MNRKELKKKITDLLKEFKTVKVSNTKTGILVETFKNDDFIQATWQQVFCLKKLCNHKSLLNLINIDKRVAFKIISLKSDLSADRIFILCHEKEQ